MANSADPDQLASSELIWIYIVRNGRVYTDSAGQGLIKLWLKKKKKNIIKYYIYKSYYCLIRCHGYEYFLKKNKKKNKRTMMVLYRSPEQTALQTYC